MNSESKRRPRTILAAAITLILVLSIGMPTALADSGSDSSYTVNKRSSEFLDDLLIKNGTLSPSFDPDRLKYTVALDEHTSSFNIDVVRSNPLNKVYMNNRLVKSGRGYGLENGCTRVVKVKVVTPEKKTRTYTVTFKRPKSTNTGLDYVKVKGFKVMPAIPVGELKAADVVKFDYICLVPLGTKKVTVYAKADERHAWLSINGKVTRSRTITLKSMPLPPPGPAPHALAMNIVTIVVKAQDGSMKSYRLLIGYMRTEPTL